MTVTADQAKSFAISDHTPICSKDGECICQFYVSRISASCRANERVVCESKPDGSGYGSVSRSKARECYKRRLANGDIKAPPSS